MTSRYANNSALATLFSITRNFYFPIQRAQLSTMADIIVKDIKFDALKEKVLSKNITLIDVREPDELTKDGKIPNSINIPLGEIAEAFKLNEMDFQKKYGISKPRESEEFVISCRSGKRATNAIHKLSPHGYKNTLVYIGSFNDWAQNGGPIEKP